MPSINARSCSTCNAMAGTFGKETNLTIKSRRSSLRVLSGSNPNLVKSLFRIVSKHTRSCCGFCARRRDKHGGYSWSQSKSSTWIIDETSTQHHYLFRDQELEGSYQRPIETNYVFLDEDTNVEKHKRVELHKIKVARPKISDEPYWTKVRSFSTKNSFSPVVKDSEEALSPNSKFKEFEKAIERSFQHSWIDDIERTSFDIECGSSSETLPQRTIKSGENSPKIDVLTAMMMVRSVKLNGAEVRIDKVSKAVSSYSSAQLKMYFTVFDPLKMSLYFYEFARDASSTTKSFIGCFLVQALNEGPPSEGSFTIVSLHGVNIVLSTKSQQEYVNWTRLIKESLAVGHAAPLVKGYISKQGKNTREYLKRYFVFSVNDMSMAYYDSEDNARALVGLKRRVNVLDQVGAFSEKHALYGLKFRSVGVDKRIFYLSFDTEESRHMWRLSLQDSVDYFTEHTLPKIRKQSQFL